MLFRESVMICVWKYPGRGQYDAISHENGGSSDGNVVRILWQWMTNWSGEAGNRIARNRIERKGIESTPV